MRIIVAVVSLIAIFLGSLYDNNYLTRPNEIIWQDSVKITWDNFGGLKVPFYKPALETELKDSEKVRFIAQTVTDIVCNKEDGKYRVTSVFYAGKSFYSGDFDESQEFSETLRHELYHFHITELQARYMRRDIQEQGKVNSTELLSKYKNRLDSLSKTYDRFTRHGLERNNQRYFEKKVDSLLFVTRQFALNAVRY